MLTFTLPVECSSVHFHSSTVVTLKRIDFTGNIISEIEDGAFSKLTMLEELSLAENQLVKLPMLPAKLVSFNANHNKLRTKGIKANAFKVKRHKFQYLFGRAAFLDVLKWHFKGFTIFRKNTVPYLTCNSDLLRFQKLNKLAHLYLAHNELEAVPLIPETVRTLHLQVRKLSMFWLLTSLHRNVLKKNCKPLHCCVFRTITFPAWPWTPSAKVTTRTTSAPTWTRSV